MILGTNLLLVVRLRNHRLVLALRGISMPYAISLPDNHVELFNTLASLFFRGDLELSPTCWEPCRAVQHLGLSSSEETWSSLPHAGKGRSDESSLESSSRERLPSLSSLLQYSHPLHLRGGTFRAQGCPYSSQSSAILHPHPLHLRGGTFRA